MKKLPRYDLRVLKASPAICLRSLLKCPLLQAKLDLDAFICPCDTYNYNWLIWGKYLFVCLPFRILRIMKVGTILSSAQCRAQRGSQHKFFLIKYMHTWLLLFFLSAWLFLFDRRGL